MRCSVRNSDSGSVRNGAESGDEFAGQTPTERCGFG